MWRINNSFCFSILLVLDLCPWKSMLTYWCWSCLSSCFPCRSSECDGVTLCDTSWQLVTDGEWSGASKTRSASQLTPQWLPDYGAHHSPLRTAFRKYFHFKFSLSHAQGALLAADLLNIQISGVFASAGWPSGYLSSPNIRHNLPFLPSRHLTLNLKPKLLGIVPQWPGCECGNQEGAHNGLKYELTNWSVYHSPVTAGQELDSRHLFLTIFVLESWGGLGHPDTTELQGAKLVLSICLNCLGNVGKTTLPVNAKNFHSLIFLNSKQEIESLILVNISIISMSKSIL